MPNPVGAQSRLNSTRLVQLCRERLGWSKATTYTVIRRLAQRGVLKNENAIVCSLISRVKCRRPEIDELVEKTFDGSLPKFIAAFTSIEISQRTRLPKYAA